MNCRTFGREHIRRANGISPDIDADNSGRKYKIDASGAGRACFKRNIYVHKTSNLPGNFGDLLTELFAGFEVFVPVAARFQMNLAQILQVHAA